MATHALMVMRATLVASAFFICICDAFHPLNAFAPAEKLFLRHRSKETIARHTGSAHRLGLCSGPTALSMAKEGGPKKGAKPRSARAARREAGGFLLNPNGGPVCTI